MDCAIFIFNLFTLVFLSFDKADSAKSIKEDETSGLSSNQLSPQVHNLFKTLMDSKDNRKSCSVKWVNGFGSQSNSKGIDDDENELDNYMTLIQESSTPVILNNKYPRIFSKEETLTRKKLLNNTDVNIPIGPNHLTFIQCRVQVIFLQRNMFTNAQTVRYFLQNQIYDNEVYDFNVFITNPAMIHGEVNWFDLIGAIKWVDGFNFHGINIYNRSRIQLLCFRCMGSQINWGGFNYIRILKDNNQNEELQDGVQLVNKLNTIWTQRHQDRHGIQLYAQAEIVFPTIIHSIYSRTCQPYIFMGHPELRIVNGFYLRTSACIELEMIHKFNFSINDGEPNSNEISPWEYGYFSKGDILVTIEPFATRVQNIVLIDVAPYHFIIVLDKSFIKETNIEALFTSCDKATWALTLTTTLIVTIYLVSFQFKYIEKHSSTKKAKPKQQTMSIVVSQFIHVMIKLFGNLLSQGFSLLKVISSKESLYLAIFGSWLLFTILLTNGYASILSSLMTKQVLPDFPKTLQEIYTMSYPAIMLSANYYTGTKGSIEVYPAIPKRFPNSTCEYCTGIINTTIYPQHPSFLRTPSSTILRTFIAVMLKEGGKGDEVGFQTNAGNKSLGRNFAMIESRYWYIMKQEVIRQLSNSKLVIKDGDINEFVEIRKMSLSANYLFALVKGSIQGLVEAGIIEKWKVIAQISYQLYYADQQHNRTHRQESMKLIHQLPKEESKEPEPLGLIVIIMPLTVLGIFLTISLVVFCLEIITRFIINTIFIWALLGGPTFIYSV